MENNINNKKSNLGNMYKNSLAIYSLLSAIRKLKAQSTKLLLVIFTFIFLIMNANAIFLETDSSVNYEELLNYKIPSYASPELLISLNNTEGVKTYNLAVGQDPIYMSSTTLDSNVTLLIIYQSLGIQQFKFINLTPGEPYYTKFFSNNQYEEFMVILGNENTGTISNTFIFGVSEPEISISSITQTLVNAMVDLIQINIGFWKLIYYLFIFSIVIGGIGLLVNFAFKLYDWADRVSDKKKEMFSGGHHKSRRDK